MPKPMANNPAVENGIIDFYKQISKLPAVDATVIIQVKSDEIRFRESGLSATAKSVAYGNAEDWFQLTKESDLVLSARIHGGMAGIASSTSTLLIATDIRIAELAEAMLIPRLSVERILVADKSGQKQENTATAMEVTSPKDLWRLLTSSVKVDFQAFERNRRQKLFIWSQILREVDLEMDPRLQKIVSAESSSGVQQILYEQTTK
ncbi:MAG: hypothetical protein SGARI_005767 [Bacillariaceae sp.]